MTIKDLYRKGEISVRSYNICGSNNIKSLLDLFTYYEENKSFYKFRNCGRRSNEELINLCNRYKEENTESRDSVLAIVSNLTRVKREVINSFLFVTSKNLSVRSKNALLLHLNNNIKVKNFADKIFSEDFEVHKMRNIGTKFVPELEGYISIIKDFILGVSEIQDEKYVVAYKNKLLIQQTFDIPLIPKEILESESIFLLTNFLLNQNAFFDNGQTIIIKKGLKLYEDQEERTLDEIAAEVGLSRERVRQIRKSCFEELFHKLLFINNFEEDLFQKYWIDSGGNYIYINPDLVRKINDLNNTHFSSEFISYIIAAYLNNTFDLIGNEEDVLQPTSKTARNRHHWNNFYLVQKGIASEFDFTPFTNDISKRLSDRIEESYSFNFKSYISKFLTNNKIESLDSLLPICEKIINNEFELILDLDEDINFTRNTFRQVYEYAYEALEQLGKPSQVKEIFEKVIELHPNYSTEEAKIRVSMKRRNGFVPVGRKSVFALIKWENEIENFKGGTIRDIVEEFLMQFSTPKHISDITDYVLKYRPKSNQYSILQNLKLDASGLYIFFKNSHIGLTTKIYGAQFKKISEIKKPDKKTWDERFEILGNFISEQKRMPFSTGVPEKEIKLYRWVNVQKNKENLDEIKKEKLNRLLTQFPDIDSKRRFDSIEKYEELISFVLNYHRLPSASKEDEKYLYRFFYKQRKLFVKKELDRKEEIKFREVEKLLQNVRYENKRN